MMQKFIQFKLCKNFNLKFIERLSFQLVLPVICTYFKESMNLINLNENLF